MRRLLPVVLLLVFAGSLSAQPPARTHDITPADYFTVATVTELAVSPDGKQVAYCVATWNEKADNRKTDLWVVPTDGKGKPKQLTFDRANERHPKWSADGKSIYVMANRPLPNVDRVFPQVWKVSIDGGEPDAVTTQPPGVVAFDYAPKSDTVFFTTDATAIDQDEFTDLRKKFPKPEYAGGKRTVSELFTAKAGDAPKLAYAPKRYIREFTVTQDGSKVAMVTAIDDTVLKSEGESRVDVFDMFEGKMTTPPTDVYRAKAASPWAWLESLAWNPDGTRFAFCAIFDAYPAEIIIGQLKDGKWTTEPLMRTSNPEPVNPTGTPFHVRGYGTPLKWVSEDRVSFLCESRGITGWIDIHVKRRDTVGGGSTDAAIYAFDFHTGGKDLVFVSGPNDGLPVLRYRGWRPDQVLVDPNPHVANWKLPRVLHTHWTSSDGTQVGGPLELPHGYLLPAEARAKKLPVGKPLPLVVAIHGGPTTASHAALEFDPHNGRLYFAAAGYAVLCPNYRGSTGYGDKFVTDLIGRENDIEVKDIIAGIQYLIDQGIADPDRIAVMGWSNGGYLTNCLISLKDPPFKIRAASSGAGIVDTVAEWGFNDEPAYPRVFKKGLPWETPDIYRKTSPTYQLGNVKTPTLIHVGANDERCPPGHSRMLHRALKEYVKVPTELIVYPGEPHGLTKYSHRKAKMEWDLAWFDKYVMGK